ncbi:PREDICTED: interferon-inducible GTPase 1-like, partial [Cyprinodon variegatus]|uniref:interferon-inducible GTPase 1-like n=1 Tax=Cyprinodon variegatus TaxID=28743 RepID=UPI00074254CA
MDFPLKGEMTEQIREMMLADPAVAFEKINQHLKQTAHIKLNIGITGEPGTGKSTFVNAFSGLDNNDEGAAPTGRGNTTINPTSYCHPDYPNVILWDLPGIGSNMWPADTYVERVELEKFDFFIIISANRFRENDVKLANEIQKMGKKFYFIRSKINHNLRDEGRSRTDFNEEKTLQTIMEDCIQGLNELGIESPQVFLLSMPDLKQHGLKELKSTFEKELPELQRKTHRLATRKLLMQILNNNTESFGDKMIIYFILLALEPFLP